MASKKNVDYLDRIRKLYLDAMESDTATWEQKFKAAEALQKIIPSGDDSKPKPLRGLQIAS